jgi:pimeloyl-ACP methyl ester carboxylesterase
VAGDEDAVAPVHGVRALAARLSAARIETLARCGHWMTVERDGECRGYLQPFLERRH